MKASELLSILTADLLVGEDPEIEFVHSITVERKHLGNVDVVVNGRSSSSIYPNPVETTYHRHVSYSVNVTRYGERLSFEVL